MFLADVKCMATSGLNLGTYKRTRTWSNIARQSWIGEISWMTGGSIPQLLQLVLVLFLETERGQAILGVKPHRDDQLRNIYIL